MHVPSILTMLRLGVDVGGTNTDAVLLRGDTVVGSAKRVTSADRLSGIQNAVQSAIAGCSAGVVNKQLGKYRHRL